MAFIEDFYDQRGIKLSVSDSVQLATVILFNAEELHTFEGSGKRKNDDLIPLSENVAGHKLKIYVPYTEQGIFLTGVPPLT